jgi:triphosphatase
MKTRGGAQAPDSRCPSLFSPYHRVYLTEECYKIIVPTESEIKLRLDPGLLAQVKKHPLITEGARQGPLQQHFQSTYFDTLDLQILAQGMGLRIRRVGARWIQTLKGGSSGGAGLHRRQEWESEVEGNAPALDRLAEEAKVGILRERELERCLIPVFKTDFWRTTWHLQGAKGSLLELALDLGEISSRGHTEPLSELELELEQGQEQDLYEAALRLAETLPVAVEHASKAERGYRLYRQQFSPLKPPGPVPSKPAADPEMLRYWLARLQYGERLLLERDDAQGIGHLRVAAEVLQDGLRGAKLGEALLQEDLEWLISGVQPQRDPDLIREWVRAPRYSRLLLRLGAYSYFSFGA